MTFSNIESSETPPEIESNEIQEHAESPEVQEEAQQLEQATFEPEAVIELERTHEEAEAIESAFVETMRGAESSAGEGGRPGSGVKATPINLPNPVEESAVLPIPVPSPQGETGDSAVVDDSPNSDFSQSDNTGAYGFSGDGNTYAVGFTDHVFGNTENAPPSEEYREGRGEIKSTREEAIPQPTEGKYFDTTEPAMENMDPAAIIDSNDSPHTAGDGVMIDTVPLPEQPAETGQEVSIPESIANDGEALQIMANILKNEQDEANPLIENRRGAESETGQKIPGAALEEDAVGISPDDVKNDIGTWPTQDMTVDGIEIDPDQPIDDPDAPMQDNELIPPQDGMDLDDPANVVEDSEAEEKTEENEAGELQLPSDWHLYTDKDGNDIIVDSDGKPVDSAPIVYDYQGKKYLAYPGDAPAVDASGKVINPQNLVEAPAAYIQNINDMYIHEDSDGKLTVVDKNGKPVDSPPKIVEYYPNNSGHPVKYLAYPGSKPPFDEKGKPLPGANLNPASEFNAEIKDMYIHEDTDGTLTVVDKNGKPVDSPPKIVEYYPNNSEHPVKYLAYPGTKPPFDETGKPLPGEKLNPAQEYNAEIKDMYIHEDTDGTLTVVDNNGKPVDSPPKIVEYYPNNSEHPAKYLAYPGTKPPFDETGKPLPGAKLNPAEHYNGEIKDMFIHEGPDGKVTVVDKNGKPVESPPKVVEYDPNNDGQTEKYLAYPGTKSPFDESGKPTGEKLNPAQHYKGSTDGLYMHDDGDGNITVVNEKGQPVDSPPDIIQLNGKYYMAYPGTKEAAAIKADGTINAKDAKEITYYKPDWWAKNVKQEAVKGI